VASFPLNPASDLSPYYAQVLVPVERLVEVAEKHQHVRLDNLSHCLRSQLALLNFLHRCQTSAAASPIQNLIAKSTGSTPNGRGASAANAPPPPPPSRTHSSSSPSQTMSKTMSGGGGFMNFANPIKALGHKSASAPGSMKGSGPSADGQTYKPTLAELASGKLNGPGPNRPSTGERVSESSGTSSARNSEAATGGVLRGAVASGANGSFDQDSESDGDDDDDEHADDRGNPDNAIEKAVRHMRVALATLQRNSGLVLEKMEPYDHCNCSDCAIVYDMANDCCMHIAAANFRSKQCAERLLRLGAYKDRMREHADQLDAQEPA
jgi:hypothetical protein